MVWSLLHLSLAASPSPRRLAFCAWIRRSSCPRCAAFSLGGHPIGTCHPESGRAPPILTAALGLYLLANLASTVMSSLDVASSLRIVLWLSLSFAAYLLAIAVAGRSVAVGALVDDVVAIGAAASATALVLYGLAALGISSLGVQTDFVTGQVSAKGVLYEANLLGSFAAMTTLLAASQLIHSRDGASRRRTLYDLCAVSSVATFVSYLERPGWVWPRGDSSSC